jgi:hypothetical protein
MEAPGAGEPATSLPAFTPVVFSGTLYALDSQGAATNPTDVPGTNEDISRQGLIGETYKSIRLTQTTAANHHVEIDFCPGSDGCP